MSMISKYVREQRRYTKNELKKIFEYESEDGIGHFIRCLKAYGVLKSVKNTDVEREMSDLLEDDMEITDGSEDSGSCLYVFTFVGIITCGDRIIKVYPKYLLSKYSKDELLIKMRQIVKVLEKYSNSEEQIINIFNGEGENRSFNTLAVILFLLKDYYDYGVYSNSEDIIEVNGEGEILWGKTVDESFALIADNKPYYMDIYTRKNVDDELDYFKRLHECIVTECSKQLEEAELATLFGLETAKISEESLVDFGEKSYVLEKIVKELNVQYNTRKQIILKTIYAFISQDKRLLDDNYGFSMFGTTAFHAVWEKMCSEVFDNKLHKSLGQLNLYNQLRARKNNSVDYMVDEKLIEIIPKPIWENKEKKIRYEAQDTLTPDLISFYEENGKRQFIIFDAKYYNIQLEENSILKGYPGVGDVTKQYLYHLAYRDFIEAAGFVGVKNCFLMPTERSEIIKYGVAIMPILEMIGLENIQVRLIPGNLIAECYLTKRKIDIADLAL